MTNTVALYLAPLLVVISGCLSFPEEHTAPIALLQANQTWIAGQPSTIKAWVDMGPQNCDDFRRLITEVDEKNHKILVSAIVSRPRERTICPQVDLGVVRYDTSATVNATGTYLIVAQDFESSRSHGLPAGISPTGTISITVSAASSSGTI